MSRLARGLGFYLAVALVCVAALALVELSLRAIYPEKIPATDYETLEPDPALGYRLVPSNDAVYERLEINGGQRIRWSTNRQGYRGDELRTDGSPRVVVYGDSSVQGVFSSLANTFPKQLETLLVGDLGIPIEVINAGVVGYGPDHYLLRLRRGIDELHPDAIILTIFADNDLGDPLRHRLFELRDGELAPRSDHLQYPGRTFLEHLQRFAARLLVTRVANKFVGLFLPVEQPTQHDGADHEASMDDYITALQAIAENTLTSYRTPGSDIVLMDYYDIDVATTAPEESESVSLKLELLRAILDESKRATDAAHIPMLVLVLPSRIDLTTNDPLSYRDLERFPNYDRRLLSSSVETICRELGIQVVNLFDTFSTNDANRLYFRGDDDHWNDAGQALAARTVEPTVRAMLQHSAAAH